MHKHIYITSGKGEAPKGASFLSSLILAQLLLTPFHENFQKEKKFRNDGKRDPIHQLRIDSYQMYSEIG